MWFRGLLRKLFSPQKRTPKKTTSLSLLHKLSTSQLRYIARKKGVTPLYGSREDLIKAILAKDLKK